MSLVKSESPLPGVTVLTLNRPDKRNALSRDLMRAIVEAFEAAKESRVIILKGEGPVFCAGLDLQETLTPGSEEEGHEAAELVKAFLETIYHSPAVTIAAIHGGAIAGGAGLMSVCDLVVAAEGTKVGYPETRRGLVAGLVMTFVRRQLRERDAREILLCADLIDAQRAYEMGLVNRVVPADKVEGTVMELTEQVLKGAPKATAKTKEYLDNLWSPSVQDDLDQALR